MTIRKMKLSRDPWHDPGVIRTVRGYGDGRIEGRLKRSNLSDPERIERLRWRALLRFEAVAQKAYDEAKARIVELGDAFVAAGSEQDHGWTSLPREEATKKRPRHLIIEDRHYVDYGPSVCEDRNYWDEPKDFWDKPKVGRDERNSALEELAVVEHDAWWEEEELPRRKKWWKEEQVRRKALATPEKLAAGAAWEYANHLCHIMRYRVGRIDRILLNSIKELDFLPKRPHYKHPVVVILNGRHYSFESRGGWLEAESERWPHPGKDRQCVFKVPQFKLDESLIGKSREVVWTRFGEPPVVLGTSKADNQANIWIYGSIGLRFERAGYGRVEKILTPKEVSSFLKRAK